jgi:hypothetical protein
MLKKYISKFVMDVFPSVIATIIGAYIVNHYIVAKPATDAPVAAAVSTVDPKPADAKTADAKTADPKKTDAKTTKADAKGSEKGSEKSPETSSDVAGTPDPGTVKKNTADKATEKPVDKPADTASLPVETRRHQPAPRDKTVAKTTPAPAQTPAPAVAAASVVPVEANSTLDERRDANDMARAAIERLRNSSEASRAPDAPRVQDAPRVTSAPVQPLPPAIMVSTPSGDAFNPNGTAPPRPPYAPVARVDDPRRPTPPADIPTASRPIDLHAEATASMPEQRTTVADDMLSAAKSVFHAVLPR